MIERFSDAAFGNLEGGGYVIFFSNDAKKVFIGIRGVVKSVMAAETLSLLDAAEAGLCLKATLKKILQLGGKSPVVKCYVDSKSLVESVYSTRLVQDRRLRIDMMEQKEIHAISLVQSAH